MNSQHLIQIDTPLLVVAGGNDCLSGVDEWEALFSGVGSEFRALVVVAGGTHQQWHTQSCTMGDGALEGFYTECPDISGSRQREIGLSLVVEFARAVRGSEPWEHFEAFLQHGTAEHRWDYKTHLTTPSRIIPQPGCPCKDETAARTTAAQKIVFEAGGRLISSIYWPNDAVRFRRGKDWRRNYTGRQGPYCPHCAAGLGPYWYPPGALHDVSVRKSIVGVWDNYVFPKAIAEMRAKIRIEFDAQNGTR
jgi:hypothetical protein